MTRRRPLSATHLHFLAPVGDVVLPGDVLLLRLVLVLQPRTGAGLDYLHSEVVTVGEEGGLTCRNTLFPSLYSFLYSFLKKEAAKQA